jgi:cation diffusion facilitator family transporter
MNSRRIPRPEGQVLIDSLGRAFATARSDGRQCLNGTRGSDDVAVVKRAGERTTYLSVVASVVANCMETIGLGVTAWASGSTALRAQTAAEAAEVAVTAFLLVGVLSSVRGPDDTHPLGYGRERFFWSLFAALGLFVGGSGLALDEAVRSALHPSPVHSYVLAYVVLAVTAAVDAYTVDLGLRPLRQQAADRGLSPSAYLPRSTDPATVTVVVGGGCAVVGAMVAAVGLVVSQTTRSPIADTVASGSIGLLLFVASVLLLRTNRDLLTGRGVSSTLLHDMRQVIASQPGVVDVPDLFAVVVGPLSLIVDGDVTFAKELDVPAVEQVIIRAVADLQNRWPMIQYVYLTPVPKRRRRRSETQANESQPGNRNDRRE